jgi:pyrroline-5-carboxylate reductase
MKGVVFLGGGRITSALVAGLRRAGYRDPLIVHDRHPAKLRRLEHEFSIVVDRDLERAVAAARLLIIAVRPQSVAELLQTIAPPRRPLIAVSLAAGIPLAKMRAGLGPAVRWARAMPSPACRSGPGLTALAFDRAVPPRERAEVRHFFAKVGAVLEIPEAQFDAFTVTYSVSHGYHALASLAAAAEKVGLNRQSALAAAAHALADGIAAWRAGRVPLPKLIEEAATPGGIAAAVMSQLDADGYQRLIVRALRAGLAQARRNAKLTQS